MKIIVVGAGTVGANIAKHLVRENHEVVIIDLDGQKLGLIEEELDVQTFAGNGTDPVVLRQVAVENSALLLAVTERDEVNLVASFAAKKAGCPRVIARVRSRYYYNNSDVNFRESMGIDLMISPEVDAAWELAKLVRHPGALAMVSLADRRVQLRTVRLTKESEFCGKTLQQLSIPQGALIAGTRRGDTVAIAHGNTRLEADDRVTLIGLPDVLNKLSPRFDRSSGEEHTAKVTIAGAGATGLYLAEILERRGHRVTVIDRSSARAQHASECLQKTRVLHGDATEVDFLREERIGRSEYFIAVTGDDENNIMSSLLAKELGVSKVGCLIARPDYTRVVERIGIDMAISPRLVVATRVLGMVKRGRIKSVTLLEEGEMEIYEYQAMSKSPIVGTPLKDLSIPKGAIIGAVVSGGQVSIPRGDYVVKPGCTVVGITRPESADKMDTLFAEVEAAE